MPSRDEHPPSPDAATPAAPAGSHAAPAPVPAAPGGSRYVDTPARRRAAFLWSWGVVALVGAFVVVAFVDSARTAVWFLAVVCAVLAAVRLGTAGGGALRARNRVLDATILLAAAAALLLFAPIAALPPVA